MPKSTSGTYAVGAICFIPPDPSGVIEYATPTVTITVAPATPTPAVPSYTG